YYVYAGPETMGVYLGQINGTGHRRLLSADSAAIYVSSGHLLFVRKGTLLAQKFDPGRLELTGDPVAVAENVAVGIREGSVALSGAASGIIAYRGGTAAQNRLEWIDRSGKTISALPITGSAPAI